MANCLARPNPAAVRLRAARRVHPATRWRVWIERAVLNACLLTISTTAIAQEACPVVAFVPERVAALESTLAVVPANNLGCERGVAVRLPGGVRVWRCAVEYAEGEIPEPGADTAGLLVQVGPQVVSQATSTLTGASLADVRVISVDLSGDDLEEWVVALRTSESQGLGMGRWELHAFNSSWAPIGTLSDVVGWGPRAFVRRNDGQGCAALITYLRETEGPGERSDTFLTGQLAVVTAVGGFELQGDEPAFERRLDADFRGELIASFAEEGGIDGDPVSWFRTEDSITTLR